MKKHVHLFSLFSFITWSIITMSCFKQPYYISLKETQSKTITDPLLNTKDNPVHHHAKQKNILQTDLKRLHSFSAALVEMADEMNQMRQRSMVWERDYFPPEEHDKIENLIFRYRLLRQSLWELVDYYMAYRERFTDPELQTRGFLIGFSAGLHLTTYSTLVVATFLDEPMGKSKINESYHRSGIPEGTYNLLYSQVTSVDNIKALKAAWILFSNEWKDSDSTLHEIYRSDQHYREVINKIHDLYIISEQRIQFILEKEAPLFPETANRLRQTIIMKLANQTKEMLDDNLYAVRSLLFTNVSNLKMPLTTPLSFSPKQKKQIKSLLEPGDIILTYTAGYMSNIFLPGKFKHGIIYIGTPEQRNSFDITEEDFSHIHGIDQKILLTRFLNKKLDSGYPADVIEAVAEGVIFNSLDYLLDTHINRMVVLRPCLTPTEKKNVMIAVFSFLGNGYDFKFDFNDGTYQCCTEVIYRILNSKGSFNFSLIKRMGTFTLSADDIISYYLSSDPNAFEFILYAEKNPATRNNRAHILTKEEGETAFRKLMVAKHHLLE